MKRYLYILMLGVLFSFTSCVQEDLSIGNGTYPSSNGGIQIIGASEDFDIKQVGTRSDNETVSDSFISEMTMLIFKSDGNLIQGYTDVNCTPGNECTSAINIRRSNPTFLIETSKYEGTGVLASMEAGMTKKYYDNTATDITACSIYIVANAYHLIGERLEAGDIKTLSDLENALLDTNIKLDMPYDEEAEEYIGLPMIGCARDEKTNEHATFDLRYHNAESNNNAVATIPLKKLYSKVRFSIQVNSKQLVTGQTPEFELKNVEVFNVPSKVRMGYESGDYISNLPDTVATPYLYRYVSETQKTAFSFLNNSMMPSDRTCRHSSSEDTDDVVSFYFYMPEHMVTPYKNEDTYGYPTNLPKDNRQYFKPKLIKGDGSDKIATFVRIHGKYIDHNAQIHQITYDIYLGQDNTDDFEVRRNQQLDNRLIITGITNHKDAYGGNDNTISIDHRVSMSDTGYNLSIEREAILDSHFEVRPLDIELQYGSSMKIVISDENDKTWIAMEDDAAADKSGTYADNGVRNYFTTDLVSDLNAAPSTGTKANGGTIEISHSGDTDATEIHRIWFYIDENPHVYDLSLDQGVIDESTYPSDNSYNVNDDVNETDKRCRVAKVDFYFAKDGVYDMTQPSHTLNFQQWNLWRVWSEDGQRYYDIEHEEEYLHNYASSDQYGNTQEEGMPWGLNGVQLSNKYTSFNPDIAGTDWQSTYTNEYPLPVYDFYVQHDSFVTSSGGTLRSFQGRNFTSEIAITTKDLDNGVKHLTMVQQPSGAVEYCYNRNKRNSDGSVAEVEWYLPSADELEDFIVPAYASFKEFQDNYYWTSQPAYIRNIFYYERNWIEWFSQRQIIYAFTIYEDNVDYARATKIVKNNGKLEYILSGLDSIAYKADGTIDEDKESNHSNYEILGYYHKMRHYKKPNIGSATVDDNFTNVPDGQDVSHLTDYDSWYTETSTGNEYYVPLGHLYNLMQEGYHERTRNNRVRCVRKVVTQNQQ